MITSSPDHPAGFSAELRELAAGFNGRPARLADVLAATQTRGYHLLLFVIALPFVGPVPLPGFSIPFGAATALIGFRLALLRPPWLPPWILRHEFTAGHMAKLIRGVSRIVHVLELFARPRWSFLCRWEILRRLSGLLVCLSGLLLILPLPLPFSNSLPAWTVILLSAGAMAGDGLLVVAGCLSFAVSVAFFISVALGGLFVVHHLPAWLGR